MNTYLFCAEATATVTLYDQIYSLYFSKPLVLGGFVGFPVSFLPQRVYTDYSLTDIISVTHSTARPYKQ